MENLKILKKNGFYIIQYKGKNLYKSENPIIWEIVDEICMEYTTEKFAKNDIISLKRYVNKEYNGDFDLWEKQFNI